MRRRWLFDPEFEPNVVVRATNLKLLNAARAFGSIDGISARLSIAGFRASRSSTIAMNNSHCDVAWDDEDIMLCATKQVLATKRIELELWSTSSTGCQSAKSLVGRARLRCPSGLLAIAPNALGTSVVARTTVDVENCDGLPPVFEVSLELYPWTPELARAIRRRKVPELVFDVFNEDNTGFPGIFLGRAILRGSQLAAVSTVCPLDDRFPGMESHPVNLDLRMKSAHEASTSMIRIRGTIKVSLLAARSLDFLQKKIQIANATALATAAVVEQKQSSASIAMDAVDSIVDAAFWMMYKGQHLLLHIHGAQALCAPKRIKKRKKLEARNALGLGNFLPSRSESDNDADLQPNAYVVIIWNGVEIGRTRSCRGTSEPCWSCRVPLSPLEAAIPEADAGLVVDVYDDESVDSDRRAGIEGTFIGRLSLSMAQLWQLRRVTAVRLLSMGLSPRKASNQQHPDACSEYRLSRFRGSSGQHQGDPSQLAEGDGANDDGSDQPSRVLFCMSNIAVAELPQNGFRLFGRGISPYVQIKVWNVEGRSKSVRGGGTTTTWRRERINLTLDEALLREEPLLVQVWASRAPLMDTLLGEARIRLDPLVSSGGMAIPVTLELGRPGHRQQGILSCSLSYQQAAEELSTVDKQCDDETTQQVAGALRVGVLVNYEAKAAIDTVQQARRDAQVRQLAKLAHQEEVRTRATRERLNSEAELELMAAEDLEENRTYSCACDPAEKLDSASVLHGQSEADVGAGVDTATGLPWARDEWGFRRFFLGFPVDSSKSDSAES